MMISLDLHDELTGFSGRTPLFPLPNVVHFPNILLPLHVFEPRYRTLVASALEGDRLISMALLQPGWETTIQTKAAPIFPIVCVGRITAEQRLPDGRFVMLMQGLSRARLVGEENTELPYRIGRLELVRDRYPSPAVIDREHRRRELLAAFGKLYPEIDIDHIFQEALASSIPLGVLCDVLAYAMRLEPIRTQTLLEELDVDLRSDRLLRYLRELTRERRQPGSEPDFPPPFSAN